MNDTPFKNCTFLLVDDVRVTRLTIQKMLRGLGNPTIHSAENGQEAVQILAEHSHTLDALVIDFNMPVKHGLQVVKELRSGINHMKRDLPVMMITGHSDKTLFGLALSLDVNAFVLKPVGKESMVARLSRLLETNQAGENWLKPIESYKWIDVNTAVAPILENLGQSSGESALDAINAAVERAQEKYRERLMRKRMESQSAPGVEISTDEIMKRSMVPVTLQEVLPESLLAKDLIGSKNQKLLSKNMVLSRNMIDRLRDIDSMGEPISELWVVPPEPKT